MKLAVMQPYLFPYFGYFQLMAAVDTFVVYDDVSFIKQGWINRNRLKIGGEARYFSVPVSDISSNRLIRDVRIAPKEYKAWRAKFFTTVRHNYSKARFYPEIFSMIERVFQDAPGSIADLARSSLYAVVQYLDIPVRIVETSTIYGNRTLERAERLLDICRRENADIYYNAIGGASLYSKEQFAAAGVRLQFLSSRPLVYQQASGAPYIPNLSVLDLLMNASRDEASQWVAEYDLV